MGPPAIADVVLIPFPFSNLSNAKRRPAVVLADSGKGDWVMCMVAGNAYADPGAIRIGAADLARGTLSGGTSYARPGRLFTAHESLIAGFVGPLTPPKSERIRDAVINLIKP